MPIPLTKNAPVSFSKTEAAVAIIVLRWGNPNYDVDLECIVETVEDDKPTITVVQALGRVMGAIGKAPFVMLDQDMRTGGGAETMKINLARAPKIKRALVYATIYGRGNWKDVGDASVSVTHPALGEYHFALDGGKTSTCSLIDLTSDGAGGLILRREEVYIKGHQAELDRHYGWPQLNWKPTVK